MLKAVSARRRPKCLLERIYEIGGVTETALDEIAPAFDNIGGSYYICYGTHEQYFFSDYFAYQTDTVAKFHAEAKWIAAHGFTTPSSFH